MDQPEGQLAYGLASPIQLMFQSLLSWISLKDTADDINRAKSIILFQSLLSWISLKDPTELAVEKSDPVVFQSLLSWISLKDNSISG